MAGVVASIGVLDGPLGWATRLGAPRIPAAHRASPRKLRAQRRPWDCGEGCDESRARITRTVVAWRRPSHRPPAGGC